MSVLPAINVPRSECGAIMADEIRLLWLRILVRHGGDWQAPLET